MPQIQASYGGVLLQTERGGRERSRGLGFLALLGHCLVDGRGCTHTEKKDRPHKQKTRDKPKQKHKSKRKQKSAAQKTNIACHPSGGCLPCPSLMPSPISRSISERQEVNSTLFQNLKITQRPNRSLALALALSYATPPMDPLSHTPRRPLRENKHRMTNGPIACRASISGTPPLFFRSLFFESIRHRSSESGCDTTWCVIAFASPKPP